MTGAICLLTLTTFAQQNRGAMEARLTQVYPGVRGIKWDKEGKNYEAGFTYNGKAMSVVMDATGSILETETTITTAQLPQSVRDYVTRNYKGKKIAEAAEIVDAKGVKTYEAEVGNKDLLFDSNGKKL